MSRRSVAAGLAVALAALGCEQGSREWFPQMKKQIAVQAFEDREGFAPPEGAVSVAGGPGYPVNLAQVVQGWLDGSRSVRPVEEVFPRDRTKEETEQQGQAEMITSQENATVAAIRPSSSCGRFSARAVANAPPTAIDSGRPSMRPPVVVSSRVPVAVSRSCHIRRARRTNGTYAGPSI